MNTLETVLDKTMGLRSLGHEGALVFGRKSAWLCCHFGGSGLHPVNTSFKKSSMCGPNSDPITTCSSSHDTPSAPVLLPGFIPCTIWATSVMVNSGHFGTEPTLERYSDMGKWEEQCLAAQICACEGHSPPSHTLQPSEHSFASAFPSSVFSESN